MLSQPTRLYTLFIGVVLVLQGVEHAPVSTLSAARSGIPAVLELTRMIPPHSLLHIATGVIAFWFYYWGGPRGPFRFALSFGLFYIGARGRRAWSRGIILALACIRSITRSMC